MISERNDISVGGTGDGFKTPEHIERPLGPAQLTRSVAGAVQVTKRGIEVGASAGDLEELRQQFESQKWLSLPQFVDGELLELLQRKIEESAFRIVDRQTGVELRPVDCTAYLSAELLLNSPKLFRAIEAITGCARIACFSGRIYRRPPAPDYFNTWHTDITEEGRMIALSINLSSSRYSGGALQKRSSSSLEVIAQIHNTIAGDAFIFLIDESLQHRILEVEGTVEKTALAGWFRSKPDPESLFGRGR